MDENKIKQLVTAAKSGDKNAQSTIKQIINKAQNGDKDAQQVASIIQKYIKQKAFHGAKLQYIRSLKNQCPEGEELYYYKKGGRVGCGCKKKEDGGEIRKAGLGCSAVDKFKSARKMQKAGKIQEKKEIWPTDTVHIQNPKTKKMEVRDLSGKHKQFKKLTKEEYQKQSKDKKNDIDTKGYKNGGSLNGIPFYQGGTNKGGITEKSDNTKVERIPNKGEGVYEEIPVNGWDFIPVIGTYREARRLDQGDPNASVTRLGISLAGDLTGAGMIGSVAKAAGKASRIQKALKARGYQQFTKDGSQWFRLPKKIIRGYGDKLYTYEIPNIYGGSSFKTIPTVDYTPAAMAPLVQTLRVPAEAPFFNYSK